MKHAYLITPLLFLIACSQPQKPAAPKTDSVPAASPQQQAQQAMKRMDSIPLQPAGNPYEKATVEVKTFQNLEPEAKGTWGYDIYVDGRRYITQHGIPAMPGNMGFSSETKAHKAGAFVAYKIKHNIMPPAVSPQELDSLGVLH